MSDQPISLLKDKTVLYLRLLSTGQFLSLDVSESSLGGHCEAYVLTPSDREPWEAKDLDHAVAVLSKRVADYNSSPEMPSLGPIPSEEVGLVEVTVKVTAKVLPPVKLPLRTDDDRVFDTIDSTHEGRAARAIIVSSIKNSRSAYAAEVGQYIWQAGGRFKLLKVADLEDRGVGFAPEDAFVLVTDRGEYPAY